MIRFAILPLAALAVTLSGHALSEEPIANRYVMEKTENGFVRLDTVTGEMSICSQRDGQLVCKLAADERRAFEQTLSELSGRVSALEQQLGSAPPRKPGNDFPDNAELDRALDAMEKMMRGFFGMVEDLREDFGDMRSREPGSSQQPDSMPDSMIEPDPDAEPLPDRT